MGEWAGLRMRCVLTLFLNIWITKKDGTQSLKTVAKFPSRHSDIFEGDDATGGRETTQKLGKPQTALIAHLESTTAQSTAVTTKNTRPASSTERIAILSLTTSAFVQDSGIQHILRVLISVILYRAEREGTTHSRPTGLQATCLFGRRAGGGDHVGLEGAQEGHAHSGVVDDLLLAHPSLVGLRDQAVHREARLGSAVGQIHHLLV